MEEQERIAAVKTAIAEIERLESELARLGAEMGDLAGQKLTERVGSAWIATGGEMRRLQSAASRQWYLIELAAQDLTTDDVAERRRRDAEARTIGLAAAEATRSDLVMKLLSFLREEMAKEGIKTVDDAWVVEKVRPMFLASKRIPNSVYGKFRYRVHDLVHMLS